LISCTIRPYSDKDFDDYAGTLVRTWPCEDIHEARQNVEMATRRVKVSKNEEIWVAELDGRAIGFVLFAFSAIWGQHGEAFDEEAVGIDWFDVHPDFQRKGIGRRLLQKAEERGRERGLRLIFLHTSTHNLVMMNFASKNGFRFEKFLKEFWSKGTEDAYLLVKRLRTCSSDIG